MNIAKASPTLAGQTGNITGISQSINANEWKCKKKS